MTNTRVPKNPAIYVRISDDREGEAKGVKRQLEDCHERREELGWPDAVVFNDNDRSAWKLGAIRPEYRAMLESIAAGTTDAVLVYDLDRLCRQPAELEEFVRVCDASGLRELVTVTGAGDIDLGSGDGLLVARIKGAVAAKESDDKSRRIKRKHLELARAGKGSGGGTRPFGFEDDRRTIRASEAAIVIEVADRVLASDAIRGVCFDLNERGIKTSTGGKWMPQVMTRMLKSGRISGRREHRGEIVADADWPRIISARDSDRLRAILSDPARRKNERARRYLLAGKLVCKHCGEPLVSRPRDDGTRRYVCARRPGSDACGKLAILAEELEQLVSEAVAGALDGPALTRALTPHGDREDAHQRTIDGASEQLEELARTYGEQRISMPEYLAARGPIDARLDAAKAALAHSNGTSAVADFVGHGSALRDAWGGLSFSRRRAILGAVLDKIVIGPGRRGFNRFDPSRVALVWKV